MKKIFFIALVMLFLSIPSCASNKRNKRSVITENAKIKDKKPRGVVKFEKSSAYDIFLKALDERDTETVVFFTKHVYALDEEINKDITVRKFIEDKTDKDFLDLVLKEVDYAGE